MTESAAIQAVHGHRKLVRLLQQAYSAEKAPAFAYIGLARWLRQQDEKEYVAIIEQDEWDHRDHVLKIMQQYDVPISRWYELKYHIIGKIISWSCHVIGRFMP